MRKVLFFLAWACVASLAHAAPTWSLGSKPCWEAAGTRHGVDPWLLYAIAYVESGHNPDALATNKNGTRDIGLMQINSVWLPELKKWDVSEDVLFNACASTYVGAWIMASNFRRYGNSWKAIAAYNVGSLNTKGRYETGLAYARKVYAAHAALVQQAMMHKH